MYRKLLGQELSSCSLPELQEIDSQLQRSLGEVRARKVYISSILIFMTMLSCKNIHVQFEINMFPSQPSSKLLSSFRYELEHGFFAVVWRHMLIN